MKQQHNILRTLMIVVVIILCIIAVAVAVYSQFFYKYGETDRFMLGKVDKNMANQEMYTTLKNNFSKLFTGSTVASKTIVPYVKKEASKGMIYSQKNTDQRERQYSMDVNIPVINIASTVINEVNSEIQSVFGAKVKAIRTGTEVYTIYNVNYTIHVNVNILSIVIRATLKEGNNAQRIIIQTYTYDMEADKLLTLSEIIEQSNMNINSLQDRINKEISNVDKQNQELEEIGYSVFKRDLQDEMYKVENSNNFFLSNDGYLYIIYAYGNNKLTSEIDLVII